MRMFEGRHQHATIDQAVIDYLRANYGGTRLRGNPQRQNLERAHHVEPGDLDRLLPVDTGRESPDRLDFDECARWIGNQIDRASFGLSFKWGLNAAEIGDLFGFSESRVSQRLERVQKCISARAKAQKSGTSSRQMATILRPEAERHLWWVGEITFERMETGQSFSVASFNEKSF